MRTNLLINTEADDTESTKKKTITEQDGLTNFIHNINQGLLR